MSSAKNNNNVLMASLKKKIRALEEKINYLDSQNFQLKNLIDNLPGDIYWKDIHGSWSGMNKRCVQSLHRMGIINECVDTNVIGKSDYDLFDKKTADGYRKNDNEVMDKKIELCREEFTQLPSGEKVILFSTKTPLWDKDKNIVGIVGNTVDISYLKNIESALLLAREAAESANHAKTEFIANMSHDIRTPLTGVVGMSHMLEDNAANPKQKQYAHWIGESGDQLLHMLNGILDVVSADNVSETDLNEEPFDVRHIVEEILQLERPSTLIKGIELFTQVDDDIPPCLISDSTKLHRIILNLLGNAIKFTKDGHVKLDVSLMERNQDGATLRFQVSDTGIGISPEMQGMVFDRFFRVTPSYKGVYTGNGVGLHIAQSYAHLLGGDITLTSDLGVGTTFSFDLTFKIGDIASLPAVSAIEQIAPIISESHASLKDAPHVLLVEDGAIALHILENSITEAGFSFTSAVDGETALDLATTQPFDLIMTDLGLPGMSGIDFTRALRAFEVEHNKKPVPIIGLTAHADSKIKKNCVKSGMNEALTKPISAEALNKIRSRYLTSNDSLALATEVDKTDLPDKEEQWFELDAFPLLDISYARKLMNDNLTLLNDSLTLIVEKYLPESLVSIEAAYHQGDWVMVEKIAHRMKGDLLYCGATKLVTACQYMERYHQTGETALLEALYQQFKVIADGTAASIKRWLAMSSK